MQEANNDPSCSDLFAPTLQTFSIDMSASDLAAMQAEFLSAGQLSSTAFSMYQAADYPAVFHYGTETVSDAYVHLKGDSSWQEAVQYDGAYTFAYSPRPGEVATGPRRRARTG